LIVLVIAGLLCRTAETTGKEHLQINPETLFQDPLHMNPNEYSISRARQFNMDLLLTLVLWIGLSLAIRKNISLSLQTISNVLASLREGDFSIQARGARESGALGEVVAEVKALRKTLKEQRLGAVEETALLENVMQEIDVAVFAFDLHQSLKHWLMGQASSTAGAFRFEHSLTRGETADMEEVDPRSRARA
jgi:hypothetical protein